MRLLSFLLLLTSGLITPGMMLSAIAQVTSDGTTNTIINSNGNNFNIINGIEKGNNLFHSFTNFSVPNNGSAIFNLVNTPNISTIFSRVTGGNVSHIDGLIQTINSSNSVNLFLMNPNGIIFGQNAKLDISGSFIATTANSIKFADGTEFSAINPQANTLLSINVPIGLQLGNNPSPIQVQGTGHLDIESGFTPVIRNPSPTRLQVQAKKTLALVGGNLNLDGATLTAETGHIELGSLGDSGLVNLVPTIQGYKLEYGNGQSFGDIQLAQKSLLDVSGVNAGSVQLQGRNIRLSDGSLVLAQNYGNLPGGDIRLQASKAIEILGAFDTTIPSGIRSDALSSGTGANISIITPRLVLQQGSGIRNSAYGLADSGNIQIEAAALEISGFNTTGVTNGVTNILTGTYASGSAGDIFVNGDSLIVSDGTSLSSFTFGSGSSGKVTIRNQNTTVMGENPLGIYSNISITSFSTGNTKDLILDTEKLQILNGGTVGSSAFFVGNGGNVSINASQAIAISGRSLNNNSSINSSVVRLNPQLRQFFGLPDILTANAGSVSVTTPSLRLTNGGTVSVTSQGTGNGGNLNITADRIQLKNQGLIQAQTESGNGGNIDLQVKNLLLMRHRSNITATAGGNGNGGNININAPIVAGLENSDIVANAVQGRGGNIQITTQGIIGLQYRPQLTALNDISASSQFGMSGTVQINNIGIDPNSGLIELPENLTDSSQQIATGCSVNTGSSFVATGRGGIPQNPTQEVRSDVYDGLRLRTWSDTRNISAFEKTNQVQAQIPTSPKMLVQAIGVRRRADGKIELIAAQTAHVQPPLTCATVSH
ncbi:S-layer family protein [Nostoc sp. ChiQUE01b]|uniref:S-layer family protein n=1 Tax=Nostoc sp. ChiQUE01b TaxID=3075376 RepID=UPI002AD39F68|nr:S-layer family protein [Nostoc sp. ChiQUE01b]MDZ8260527.1 S-layer family protein [Nostoc sp. ChiQUE01b]